MEGCFPIASIVLCAGRGKRMQAPKTPKVCFPIAGKPAIIHLLERLKALGSSPTILVVGHLAGKVVEEVGPQFPDAAFVYQEKLAGTGHAAKCGANLLRRLGFEGAVLVTAGDKVIEPRVLAKLVDAFEVNRASMALVVAPKNPWSGAGRIIQDEKGRVVRCIEKADLRHAEKSGGTFRIQGEELDARAVEARCTIVNQAIYLFRAEALFEALGQVGKDNVQKEEYLTDTIEALVRAGKTVVPALVDDPDDVMAFNSPEELLQIEEHFRRKAGLDVGPSRERDSRVFKSPEAWAHRLRAPDGEVARMLTAIYGNNPGLCEEKRRHLLEAVELFLRAYGNDGVVTVVRAPGRINLMGRHVDHRGGCVNLMAIDREQIMVARGRDDTTVRAHNADHQAFADLEFTGGELLRQVRLDDWHDFVNSDAVIQMVRDLQGDWGNYLKAAMLRLQQACRDRQIHGLDCVVRGDIPMAAGLSSSSALVVATAEALVLANGLGVSPHDLVDVCGEGEWFVGTRGGSADHAAVKLSQFGRIGHVGFFPFAIKGYVPFPSGHVLVICNSRIQARKAEGARDTFNERVASYEFAVHLVRRRFPNYAPLIHHLRDIAPESLGVRHADIYRIVLDVPERIAAEDLIKELGDETCRKCFATHRPPEYYALRARLLFGIAECARSTRCLPLLLDGDMRRFGHLMNVSHDGDRVVSRDNSPFVADISDDALRQRIADLQSEDPDRVLAAQLYEQPGRYACSTPEIDRMVDIAVDTPGVLGAQLSGAGLGGCMMVLAQEEAKDAVIERMSRLYYEPTQREPGAIACIPIAGCGPLALDS
jgi:N-acetylgalactosamine kinase